MSGLPIQNIRSSQLVAAWGYTAEDQSISFGSGGSESAAETGYPNATKPALDFRRGIEGSI